MRPAAAAVVVLAALAAPAFATSYPTHVSVALIKIPGNVCCSHPRRATVSATGVLTQAIEQNNRWKRVGRRTLKRGELKQLRGDLRRFNPADLKSSGAACHGLPIGDVGANDLRVGKHGSNCPPKSAQALVDLLSRWLPN
jgi:hypothetical protein